VLINYSRSSDGAQYHGKAIHLSADDRHAPFPAALLIHEQRVRGFHPFSQEPDDVPATIELQDWTTKDHNVTPPTGNNNMNAVVSANVAPGNSSGGPAPATRPLPPLDEHTIESILTATRQMPSWKACELEGTSWDGTAEENIEKYKRLTEL